MKLKKVVALSTTVIVAMGLLAGCAGKKNSSEVLNIYNVGDYIDESLIEKFEKETGIDVVYETYDTNEAMYQKIKSGSSNYDLIFPSDYMVEKMNKEGMLQEIDYNNIPNYKNIADEFKNLSYDPENKHSVPYLWGTFGILYNKDMVDDKVDSWNILWDEKYKGNIMMLDSVRDSMGISLKRLGYSMNSEDSKQINEAKDQLIKQKPLVAAYGNDDLKDRLVGGEAAMGIVYSGDALTLTKENDYLAYAIPKEGTNKWFDAMAIPTTAENKKEAEQFINFMLDAENAKTNVEYIGYSTPNKAALDMLPDEYKNSPIFNPSKEIIEKSEVFKDLNKDVLKEYDEAWIQIKSE
ncbi:ABC transporter substrate-binding protein [Paraclostridium bifermentans]|uniref:ABC transporter substrate-binding protein n=1 Tax=Paraclostridium bifermentans TaxID=1490 RepID=UPI00359C4333